MTDKSEFHTEFHWHRSFHAQDLVEHNSVSLNAGGLLTRLVHLMFSVNGPIKNDIAWITRRAGVRDKRTVVKALDELIKAEIILVTDEGLVHSRSMAEIKNKSAMRSENGSKRGKQDHRNQEQSPNSSPSDADLMAIKYETDPPQVIEKQQSRDELPKEPEQKKKEPTGDARETAVGGGSDVDLVIREFYAIAGTIWGQDVVTQERKDIHRNVTEATEWLRLAGGSVKPVFAAIELALGNYKKGCPGTLGAVCVSMQNYIKQVTAPCTQTTRSSAPIVGQSRGSVPSSEKAPLWDTVADTAYRNGHRDIAKQIHAIVRNEGAEAANRRAREVQEFVAQKKAEAA